MKWFLSFSILIGSGGDASIFSFVLRVGRGRVSVSSSDRVVMQVQEDEMMVWQNGVSVSSSDRVVMQEECRRGGEQRDEVSVSSSDRVVMQAVLPLRVRDGL